MFISNAVIALGSLLSSVSFVVFLIIVSRGFPVFFRCSSSALLSSSRGEYNYGGGREGGVLSWCMAVIV